MDAGNYIHRNRNRQAKQDADDASAERDEDRLNQKLQTDLS